MSTNPKFISISRKLRREQTPWEKKLWMYLKGRKFLNLKFRRQFVIESFVYDFCCFEKKLIIELDGSQHMDAEIIESDKVKQDHAESLGYNLIRFNNNDIDANIEGVLESISRLATSSVTSAALVTSSPGRRRGEHQTPAFK